LAPRWVEWSAVLIAVVHLGTMSVASPLRPPLGAAGYHVSDDPRSLESLAGASRLLAWVITTEFRVESDGTIRGTPDRMAQQVARRGGAEVHFRVANLLDGVFDRSVVSALLSSPVARTRARKNILRILGSGYDGVHLDLEGIPPSQRRHLVEFVGELKEAVRERGKTVSVAVPGRPKDDPSDEWAGAFDLAALGRSSDRIVVMAYDEHWEGTEPGPVASLPWVTSVVRFAQTQVPKSKLWLGVGLYGYAWHRNGRGMGITAEQAQEIAERSGARILWDDKAKVPFYRTRDLVVYFEDARSIVHKVELAQRAAWRGVAVWRLGQERPEVWEALRSYIGRPSDPSASLP